MRSLELGTLTIAQLDDVRAVLDVVTHELNERSRRQRHQTAMTGRADALAAWMRVVEDPDWSLELPRETAKQLYREHLHHAPPIWWYDASPEDPATWAAAHGLNTAQVLLRMAHPDEATGR